MRNQAEMAENSAHVVNGTHVFQARWKIGAWLTVWHDRLRWNSIA